MLYLSYMLSACFYLPRRAKNCADCEAALTNESERPVHRLDQGLMVWNTSSVAMHLRRYNSRLR